MRLRNRFSMLFIVEMAVTVGVCSLVITLLDNPSIKPYCYPVVMILSLCIYVYCALSSTARAKNFVVVALATFGLSLLFTLDRVLGMPLAWGLLVDMMAISAMLAFVFHKIYTERRDG